MYGWLLLYHTAQFQTFNQAFLIGFFQRRLILCLYVLRYYILPTHFTSMFGIFCLPAVPLVRQTSTLPQFLNAIHLLIPMRPLSEYCKAMWNFLDACFSNTIVASFNYCRTDANFRMKICLFQSIGFHLQYKQAVEKDYP